MKKLSSKKKLQKKNSTVDFLQKKHSSENSSLKKYLLLFLIIFIVVVIGVIGGVLLYQSTNILDVQFINASVKITESGAGLNADPGALTFGKTSPGNSAVRYILVSMPVDSIMQLRVSGTIAPYIIFPENNIFIPANEQKRVEVIVRAPENIVLGNYTGVVEVRLVKP